MFCGDLKDVREWLQLVFVVIGGGIAVAAFVQNLRQRRVENALKFISLFRDGLYEDDLDRWENLFRSSNELAGAKRGQYITEDGILASIGDYFSEGSPDGHAMARMAVSLDVVCHQVMSKAADARTVYYELGQLLKSMHDWLESIGATEPSENLLNSYPSIKAFFKLYKPEKNNWPARIYAFIE
jgi:hypothetical protein